MILVRIIANLYGFTTQISIQFLYLMGNFTIEVKAILHLSMITNPVRQKNATFMLYECWHMIDDLPVIRPNSSIL